MCPTTGSSTRRCTATPKRIFGIGLNYIDHAGDIGDAAPQGFPGSFFKMADTLIGPDDEIHLPNFKEAQKTTAEAELGVILGKECRDISEENWLDVVAGYTTMGVVGMSKTMAREFGPYGILVNTMGPGRIYTDRIKYLNKIRGEKLGMTEEEYTAKDSAAFPQRRYQTPEEYGRMATFLISPANGCMSGQAFIFDGAMTTSY